MKKRAYILLKNWCDTMLEYKVSTSTPYTDGALLCPACHVIHGRIADLCFPLTLLYVNEKDEKYLAAADKFIDWSEYNLKTMDGLWYNDITNRWYATSEFSAMSIGEALYHFGDKLPKDTADKWKSIFFRMCDVFITLDTRKSYSPVTNYYCGMTAVLAMAWKLSGDEKYLAKTKYWLDVALSRIDSDGLLYGEGYPLETPSGRHTVDMGYDLEESIPLLLRYSDLTGDRPEFFKKLFVDHLEFLLPDGAIDDSFGCRHNKWTYWGSRTSDGVIEGLALLLDDPTCADACERALTLYEKCTHDGLLAMPMAHEDREPTCLHHTFCHAKALATLLCAPDVEVHKTTLPCEKNYGIKSYQKDGIILVSHGKWRATFNASDAAAINPNASNGGGSMTLLYHKEMGPVCAATSAVYHPTEITNQQYLRNSENPPSMTAQFLIDGVQACYDKNVRLEYFDTTVKAIAEKWRAEYAFDEDTLNIDLFCENGIYNIPIVCSRSTAVSLSDDGKSIKIGNISLTSTEKLICDPENRIFNQVGGLMYLPVSVTVTSKCRIIMKG